MKEGENGIIGQDVFYADLCKTTQARSNRPASWECFRITVLLYTVMLT